MGLTTQSTQSSILKDDIDITQNHDGIKLALAGNPNVGKSTVFNALTGLKQHTGNWPGKTVSSAMGSYNFDGKDFLLVDLPGTYSLLSSSAEEEVARDFICFANPLATVIVCDATCLERNLNLALQIMEIMPNCVLCVNLIDEAKRKNINVDTKKLSDILGIPVVGTSALKKTGLDSLIKTVDDVCKNPVTTCYMVKYDRIIEEAVENIKNAFPDDINNKRFIALKLLEGNKNIIASIEKYFYLSLDDEKIKSAVAEEKEKLAGYGITDSNITDRMVCSIIACAENIAKETVTIAKDGYENFDRKIDKILTSKRWGIPIMLLMLGLIFYITMVGANYPSALLTKLFAFIEIKLDYILEMVNTPTWLHSILISGMYKTLAWVVSVMLPPMAIFFPMFTLLEDLGYLPRIAFNLDNIFKKCCAHGKQCLTMCMGFGCNCAGIIGARIIDSPRERLLAIVTNNFTPCNGRFPTLMAISSIFIGTYFSVSLSGVVSALSILAVILIGIFMTFLTTKLLSSTILKGTPSHFTLELPPYRKPKILETLYRSIFDRTIFVLGRAVMVAAPAGLIIWIMANTNIGNMSILSYCANFIDPFAHLFGLDGYILMAFILGIPANEIVLPIILMSYLSTGSLTEMGSLTQMGNVLVQNGWTLTTAICVMLLSLMHFPCATALLTIKKETKSVKWTLVSFVLPTAVGLLCCFAVAQVSRLF